MTPNETIRCSKMVYSPGRFRGIQCAHSMRVMRNDKPYCSKHDPEKVEAKRAARSAEWQARHDAQEQVRVSTLAIVAELGSGTPEYSIALSGKGRYTGGIILTANEAQRLIARLAKVRR